MTNTVQSITDSTLLISNEKIRSTTVSVIKSTPEEVQRLKEKALSLEMTLGNGYGPWKTNSIRIANFPAFSNKRFNKLLDFLDKDLK